MDEISKIIKDYNKNSMSVEAIARKYNRSWATVNTYISLSDEAIRQRGIRNRANSVITEEVIKEINIFLDDEKEKKVHRKQRFTATYIYNNLKKRSVYKGGKKHLSDVIRGLRNSRNQQKKRVKSHLELDFEFGKYLQVDHGPADIELNSKRVNGYLFVVSVPGTSLRFCQFYLTKASEAWGEFHQVVFSFFQGVFEFCIYDNDSVLKIPSTKKETAFAKELQSYYDFKAIYCNPGQGNEKGSVEGSVGYCRRNFMAGLPVVNSIEEYNVKLKNECIKHISTSTYYKDDRPLIELKSELIEHLMPLPTTKVWGKWYDLQVDKFQCIRIHGYRYSVPERYIDQSLKTHVSLFAVSIYDKDDELIIKHKRFFTEDHDSLLLEHFLDQLQRKPTSVSYAKVLKQADLSKNIKTIRDKLLDRLELREANLEFIKILQLQKTTSIENFEYALEISLCYGGISSDAVTSNIKTLQNSLVTPEIKAEELVESCQIDLSKQFNLSQYDSLCEESIYD